MGLVLVIILFVIAALNAASKGDFSGIEIIGKAVAFLVMLMVLGLLVGN